jgi:hypothetical protein
MKDSSSASDLDRILEKEEALEICNKSLKTSARLRYFSVFSQWSACLHRPTHTREISQPLGEML